MLIPMHDTEETSSIRMDLCPYLRYLRSRVDTIQREYHQKALWWRRGSQGSSPDIVLWNATMLRDIALRMKALIRRSV
jgi:hypothetical protein